MHSLSTAQFASSTVHIPAAPYKVHDIAPLHHIEMAQSSASRPLALMESTTGSAARAAAWTLNPQSPLGLSKSTLGSTFKPWG